jgi:hypothetical protein
MKHLTRLTLPLLKHRYWRCCWVCGLGAGGSVALCRDAHSHLPHLFHWPQCPQCPPSAVSHSSRLVRLPYVTHSTKDAVYLGGTRVRYPRTPHGVFPQTLGADCCGVANIWSCLFTHVHLTFESVLNHLPHWGNIWNKLNKTQTVSLADSLTDRLKSDPTSCKWKPPCRHDQTRSY